MISRPEAFDRDPLTEIKQHEIAGNFNTMVCLIADHADNLAYLRPELKKVLEMTIRNHSGNLSPATIKTLAKLPSVWIDGRIMAKALGKSLHPPSGLKVGCAVFPVVANFGQLREVCVAKRGASKITSMREQSLDRVGASLFDIFRKTYRHILLWKPEQFYFSVIDPYGKEDNEVTGDSLTLPLSLALCSHITGIPLPADISATAEVKRNGHIAPVSAVRAKLSAISIENHYIKRVLVSAKQRIDFPVPGIKLIRVENLREAIASVFGSLPRDGFFPAELDIDNEVAALRRQYDSYQIDTCLENAACLIVYLRSAKCPLPKDRRISALFTCYWRKGCCHCHKGQTDKAFEALGSARKLHDKHKGLIRYEDFLQSLNNYAVALKDVFRYVEAEKQHHKIHKELEKIGALNHPKGKNLSSLSQVKFARRQFPEAVALQKNAIGLINEQDRHRNYGYLAWIYTRMGDLAGAQRALKKAEKLHEKSGIKDQKFYHWIKSEYLYRRVIARKKGSGPFINQMQIIAAGYANINHYTVAFVFKYYGLALLAAGDEKEGLKRIREALLFFESHAEPMMRLIGASIRAERALYFLKGSGMASDVITDIREAQKSLMIQKDVKRFFASEIKQFRNCQKKISSLCISAKLMKSLEALICKIPY